MTTQVAKEEEIALLVERLAMASGADRRQESRFTGSLAVEVQPLTDTLEPIGALQQGIARDISPSGIAIMHNDPVHSKFLGLRLLPPGQDDAVQLVLEVSRCRQVGDFFDIAGTFLTS